MPSVPEAQGALTPGGQTLHDDDRGAGWLSDINPTEVGDGAEYGNHCLIAQLRALICTSGTPSGIRTRDLHLERVAS
jgi:hypothetical protein